MIETKAERRIKRVPTTRSDHRGVVACGWCKGFVHEEWRSGMVRYVHDEPPLTDHEVLPYQPSWTVRS